MQFPPATSLARPSTTAPRWFGLLALPALFSALGLTWISFSESLLRIAAPDPGVLPMLRMLNNALFILLTATFWTGWLVRQAVTHHRRETLLRTLLEQAPIPLVLTRKGRVIACNPAFAILLGHADPNDVIDYPLLSRISAEEQRELMRQLKGVDPRHPSTLQSEIHVLDARNKPTIMTIHIRRCLLDRSVYELVCCYPKQVTEDSHTPGAELGLQLLEALPQALWLWTPQGLCLWRNQAARQENQSGIQYLSRRYGAFREGRPIGSLAHGQLMKPALEAEGSICVSLPAQGHAEETAHADVCVLPIRNGEDQVQAIAMLLESGNRPDGGALSILLLRSMHEMQQRLRENPSPEHCARTVLETIRQQLAPHGWIGLLQADLQTRTAGFWNLSESGALTLVESHLPADLAAECGTPGWSDLSSLKGIEALPPFLAQLEEVGIDQFERILPSTAIQGRRQVLLLSCRLPPEAELWRIWIQIILEIWNESHSISLEHTHLFA